MTYGGIVTGIGTGLFVSSFAYWFESWFGQLAQKDLDASAEKKKQMTSLERRTKEHDAIFLFPSSVCFCCWMPVSSQVHFDRVGVFCVFCLFFCGVFGEKKRTDLLISSPSGPCHHVVQEDIDDAV